MEFDPLKRAYEGASYIKERVQRDCHVAVILGSGLSDLTELNKTENIVIGFDEIPGFSKTQVEGHPGKLVFCDFGDKKTVFVLGRRHLYEGIPANEIAITIWALSYIGIRTLIITNAAGALNPVYVAGDIMMITDHINLTGTNPLIGIPDVKFIDLKDTYSSELRNKALSAANKLNIKARQGVYVGLVGPTYETDAEIEYFKRIGGDAVGMSTVNEVIAASYVNMRVLGLSVICNPASRKSTLAHEEVLRISRQISPNVYSLLKETAKML